MYAFVTTLLVSNFFFFQKHVRAVLWDVDGCVMLITILHSDESVIRV